MEPIHWQEYRSSRCRFLGYRACKWSHLQQKGNKQVLDTTHSNGRPEIPLGAWRLGPLQLYHARWWRQQGGTARGRAAIQVFRLIGRQAQSNHVVRVQVQGCCSPPNRVSARASPDSLPVELLKDPGLHVVHVLSPASMSSAKVSVLQSHILS